MPDHGRIDATAQRIPDQDQCKSFVGEYSTQIVNRIQPQKKINIGQNEDPAASAPSCTNFTAITRISVTIIEWHKYNRESTRETDRRSTVFFRPPRFRARRRAATHVYATT